MTFCGQIITQINNYAIFWGFYLINMQILMSFNSFGLYIIWKLSRLLARFHYNIMNYFHQFFCSLDTMMNDNMNQNFNTQIFCRHHTLILELKMHKREVYALWLIWYTTIVAKLNFPLGNALVIHWTTCIIWRLFIILVNGKWLLFCTSLFWLDWVLFYSRESSGFCNY